MLKMTVPTCTTLFALAKSAGVAASASIRKTSRSGRLNGTCASQLGAPGALPRSSSQRPLAGLNFTIRPVLGAPGVEPGGNGGRGLPLPDTVGSRIDVVWLPVMKPAA